MTNQRTGLRELQRRADKMAAKLKAWERGDVASDVSGQIAAWRARNVVAFSVPVDADAVTFEMPWAAIAEASEAELAFFILKGVRDTRDGVISLNGSASIAAAPPTASRH